MLGEPNSLFRRLLQWGRAYRPSVKTMHIRAVAFQERDHWCAQCLEYDIAVQSENLHGLRQALEQAFIDRIQVGTELGVEPFSILPPAPEIFFKMYEAATPRMIPSKRPSRRRSQTATICPDLRFARDAI